MMSSKFVYLSSGALYNKYKFKKHAVPIETRGPMKEYKIIFEIDKS